MSMFNRSFDVLNKTSNLSRLRTVFLTKADILVLLKKEGLESEIVTDSYSAFWELNIWCALFQDVTGDDGSILANRLRFCGLTETINEADDFRISLAKDSTDAENFWSRYFAEYDANASTLLGFCRRMRLIGKEPSTEIDDFKRGNVKCYNHNRMLFDPNGTLSYEDWLETHTSTPGFILDYFSEIFSVLFEDYEQDTSLFILPPGVSAEGAHTYLEKFNYVCEEQLWLKKYGVIFPLPLPFSHLREKPYHSCRYQLIPKSFKTKRGIAPEPVSKQVLGYQVDSGLRRCLKEFGCDLNDQTRNQMMSSSLLNSTEDMTAASDSISLFLVEAACSKLPKLLEHLKAVRSEWIKMPDGSFIRNHRFATMGNACTFSIESAIFLTAALVSIILTDGIQLTSKNIKRLIKKLCKLISVYGDDVVLPVKYHDTFGIVCEKLGFTVNTKKSFSTPYLYRESCGKEWYNGKDVTGTILSRGISKIPLAELVSLQHKLVEYETANTFLCSVILDVFPDITTSSIGSPYHDIWYDNPMSEKAGCSPYGEIIHSMDITGHFEMDNRNVYRVKKELTFGGRIRYRRTEDFNPQVHLASAGNFESYLSDESIVNFDLSGFDTLRLAKDTFNIGKVTIHIDRIWPETDETHIVKRQAPHDDNYEVHTMIASSSGGKVPRESEDKVELLAYLMTLGRGIEHVNSSAYTKDEDMILDRRDLCHKRKIQIKNKRVVD